MVRHAHFWSRQNMRGLCLKITSSRFLGSCPSYLSLNCQKSRITSKWAVKIGKRYRYLQAVRCAASEEILASNLRKYQRTRTNKKQEFWPEKQLLLNSLRHQRSVFTQCTRGMWTHWNHFRCMTPARSRNCAENDPSAQTSVAWSRDRCSEALGGEHVTGVLKL